MIEKGRNDANLRIYTNATLKELLGVGEQLLKKYRDYGLLSYSKVGDKFWYSQKDVEEFLAKNYYTSFP